jgi:hypothetical protein
MAIEFQTNTPVNRPRAGARFSLGFRHLTRGEHLLNHAVVPLVVVERLDDPIAPVPDVPLASRTSSPKPAQSL